MNRIETETGLIFTDEDIKSGNVQKFESLTGTQLQYDSLVVTLAENILAVYLETIDEELLTTINDELLYYEDPTLWEPDKWLKYYHDGELQGKFYISNVQRIGPEEYKVTAISSVGILANSQHYGGVYSGIMFEDLVAEIIGGQIPYSIDLTVAKQPVYGWLPIATRRENLHQALFAMSASVKKDENGDMFITALSKDTAKNIPDSRIFQGGSISYPQSSKAIALSEHSYIARNADTEATLYSGEIPADSITTPSGDIVQGGLILFKEPAHDLEITGATIIESGANYAVLSPSALCTLTGKLYTHTIRQVTRPEVLEGTEDNKVTVKDATLVSVANSESVADRLADFYGSAKKVKFDFLQGDEATGDAVSFRDPFNEDTEGLIASLDMKISKTLRSTAEIIADYDPPDIGNYYNNVDILTGTQTFNVPAGTEKMRIVLIGGGSAGFKGENGHDSTFSDSSYGAYKKGAGGEGGVGGIGGDGGNILVFTLGATNVDSIEITCGAGNTQGNGQAGGDTTITTYSNGSAVETYTSAHGTKSSIGFVEVFSGIAYGYAGKDFSMFKGAKGGGPDEPGEDYTDEGGTWHGGTHGSSTSWTSGTGNYNYLTGGSGGGATHGGNGGNGGNATHTPTNDVGAGGNGGNGSAGANATAYGCGGDGGYGGGGGGCGGFWWRNSSEIIANGEIGHGGIGGNGGNGAAGCGIFYY